MKIEKDRVDVDVLVVGGGSAGLTAFLLLRLYGVDALLLNARNETSNYPKAHIVNQRSMQIFDDLGVAEIIEKHAAPKDFTKYTGISAGLNGPGPDYGRSIAKVRSWGSDNDTDYLSLSEHRVLHIAQKQLEVLLVNEARYRDRDRVRFGHEVTFVEQEEHGTRADVTDRATGRRYTVQSKYMLGADAGRTVRALTSISVDKYAGNERGPLDVITVYFASDLSQWIKNPDFLLSEHINPDTGDSCLLMQMGPDTWGKESAEWVASLSGDSPVGAGQVDATTDAEAMQRVKNILGIPESHPFTLIRRTNFVFDGLLAKDFRDKRIFILGDAAHRHPPTSGLGLNSAVQDSYNLAWKLAYALQGSAGEALLDSFTVERRPVAERNIRHSFQNAGRYGSIYEAAGLRAASEPEHNWGRLRELWSDTDEGRQLRIKVRDAMFERSREYRALNVEFGYVYTSTAVIPDEDPYPASVVVDPIRVYSPHAAPGHPIPHAWLEDAEGKEIPISRILRAGRFTLVIDAPAATEWKEAAAPLVQEGCALDVVSVGTSGADYLDTRLTWRRVREVTDTGAVLVRPDRIICWRKASLPDRPGKVLRQALHDIGIR
ncbi:FAD-dependent monooxygenase [Mycobacteroides abscessus]|uniref:FAD-dependent monooxygenase n=1 Tax=Mycobacteroides abscessus TaxID=36809 RepID=UPI00025879EE|nr:FAD-dependent monooxygenase [Mycobacteroides abscessus]EIC67512.1 FAD-binding monooxygenase [Mycobacteroides abscessus M93]